MWVSGNSLVTKCSVVVKWCWSTATHEPLGCFRLEKQNSRQVNISIPKLLYSLVKAYDRKSCKYIYLYTHITNLVRVDLYIYCFYKGSSTLEDYVLSLLCEWLNYSSIYMVLLKNAFHKNSCHLNTTQL